MTTFEMGATDPAVLLNHLAFYGLADILDDAGVRDVRLSWNLNRPTIDGHGVDLGVVDDAVRGHLIGRRAWTDRDLGTEKRGLMSPRLTVFKDDAAWAELQHQREVVLEELTGRHAWADLRYLAALGEPCYWSRNQRGDRRQDDGASRLEMQPRNRGSEFVGNRLRPLAAQLAARPPGSIAAGLDGSSARDELGGKSDSVSATGLTIPGPVDNAVVWCALWGIGQLPLAFRVNRPAATSGHLGRSRQEWFYAPVWEGSWRPARLRSILASTALCTAASGGLPDPADPLAIRAAGTWLSARGVLGIARFPIGRFGSDNAPERRALRGDMLPVAGLLP
ncbi:MAG: hypothetical protein L0H84_01390 [Pseudonocardia sp.]|nr:hypothetical protein [Pseudonocardia sp.]